MFIIVSFLGILFGLIKCMLLKLIVLYVSYLLCLVFQAHDIDHLVIPTRDYLFAPSFVDIDRAVNFIHSKRKMFPLLVSSIKLAK